MWLTVIAEYSLQVQVLLWTRRVRRVFWLWTTHCEPFVLDSVKLQSLAARASACIQAPLRSSQSSECSRQMAHASPLMRQVGGSSLGSKISALWSSWYYSRTGCDGMGMCCEKKMMIG